MSNSTSMKTKQRDDIVSTSAAGSGCFGDPPDFPTYFYGVVTDLRRRPDNRGSMSLDYAASAEASWVSDETKQQAKQLIADWYATGRLPETHERVQLWQAHTYQHFASCYAHPTEPDESKRPGSRLTVIYPVPSYKLRLFVDDPRFSDEWSAIIEQARAIDQANAEIIEQARAIATPDNHQAVVAIRRFYPEHEPRLDWIASPPKLLQADWWQTCATRPATNEECKRTCRNGIRADHGQVDASEGKLFCRWCGYGTEGKVAK